MIIGLVSDFLPECKSKISFGLFIHHAGTFGVTVLSMFLKFMFADSSTELCRNFLIDVNRVLISHTWFSCVKTVRIHATLLSCSRRKRDFGSGLVSNEVI